MANESHALRLLPGPQRRRHDDRRRGEPLRRRRPAPARGNASETLDTRPGIHVISPAGKLLDFIEVPEDLITNCAFGGPDRRTLYITCGKLLLSLRTRIPGKPV